MDMINGDLNQLDVNKSLHPLSYGFFRVSPTIKKSKTIKFFEDLYTYPPKFKVKWETLDELKDDRSITYKNNSSTTNLPFAKILKDLDNGKDLYNNEALDIGKNLGQENSYSKNHYLKGYKNKVFSTKFYNEKTRHIQQALKNIPVYVVLNGRGEIVLASSTDKINNTDIRYKFCGAFDKLIEKSSNIGIFFMSRNDAEIYLKETAQADTSGTKSFGLSIHCVGLDFAYRVSREYNPTLDFRFVPDLNEVKTLLLSNTGNRKLIFDDVQQQFRRRALRFLPELVKLGKLENFKGVPIYIVQTTKPSQRFIGQRYFNAIVIINKWSIFEIYKPLFTLIGFGPNDIIQRSFENSIKSTKTKNYVFFEKDMAVQFCQNQGRKVLRWHSPGLGKFRQQPKIFVHNLEDFIELWEEAILVRSNGQSVANKNMKLKTFFERNETIFLPAKKTNIDLETSFNQNKTNPLSPVSRFLYFKYKRLIEFTTIFLNTN